MLTPEENEFLTRTGPGTPMGDLYRRFWLPVLLAEELPGPDCSPVRVQVLGEELIAFKDTAGKIGLLDRRCPHRMADLFFGRNEEHGLRCAYHGWKYDVQGRCMDIPNASEGAAYKEKIQARAYAAQERAGLVWAYMGPKELEPQMPEMEWLRVPDSHRYISKMFIGGNYLQAMEGDIDSSHVSFLHSRVDAEEGLPGIDPQSSGRMQSFMFRDKTPVWTLKDTDYGVMLAARREAGEEGYYWRVNQWLMPSYTMIASPQGGSLGCNVRVPMDDEHTLYFRLRWHSDRPLTEAELMEFQHGGVLFPEMTPGTYTTKERRDNDYLMDRASQKNFSYTGINSIPAQDFAVQEDQGGPIADRSMEHLVSSDSALIQVRQRLMRSARAILEGTEPPEAHNGDAYRVRSMDMVLPKGVGIEEGGREQMVARV